MNLGYKILPMAGSDFPYMDLPGVVRAYANVDGPFSVEAWFDSYNRGNVYVTNGPFLQLSVNGQPMGSEVRVSRGARMEIVAEADINPEVDALDRLELVVFGDVVTSEPANGRNRVTLRTQIAADRSQWMAVRAWGSREGPNDMTIAHSAPVYVIVDDRPFVKHEALAELVDLQRARLNEFLTEPVDPTGDLEPWETLVLMREEWERQQADLRPRVQEADARYRELLERTTVASVERASWPFGPVTRQTMVGLVAVTGLLSLLTIAMRSRSPRSARRRRLT